MASFTTIAAFNGHINLNLALRHFLSGKYTAHDCALALAGSLGGTMLADTQAMCTDPTPALDITCMRGDSPTSGSEVLHMRTQGGAHVVVTVTAYMDDAAYESAMDDAAYRSTVHNG